MNEPHHRHMCTETSSRSDVIAINRFYRASIPQVGSSMVKLASGVSLSKVTTVDSKWNAA